MQERSYINFNSAGKISCLLLLLITILGISPATSVSTYAEEPNDIATQNDEPSTTALTEGSYKTSSVTIGFTPTKAETTLSPIDASGERGKINVKVNVNIQNSDGYKIYVGSNSDQLKNGNDTIEPLTTEVSYNDIPANHWGYSIQEGETAKDSYKAIPTTLRGTPEITSKAEEKNIKNKDLTYTLSFAANIGADKPAGTYSNEVTVSVVSDPRELTLMTIDTMQEMTAAICNNSPTSVAINATTSTNQAQLRDTRDGKYYWVGKMPDGRCWMTQNLDLDLIQGSSTLTNQNTNITAATWAPNKSTTSDSETINADDNGQWSWSMGGSVGGTTDYYTANPDSTTNCGNTLTQLGQATGASNCSGDANGKWTSMTIPTSANGDTNAHYLLGNLYQWGAATAGQTTSSITSGESKTSICPYGWRLPTSTSSGELQALVTALSAGSSVTNLVNAPFYAVRGGQFGQDSDYQFYALGTGGYYWSSTPSDYYPSAHSLAFANTATVYPSNNSARHYGFSVRCINDPTK